MNPPKNYHIINLGSMYRPQFQKMMSIVAFRYGFEGVMLSVYGMNRTELDCDPTVPVCTFQDPMQVLKMLDVENAKLYVDFLVLGIFFTVIRVATFLVLHWKVRAER